MGQGNTPIHFGGAKEWVPQYEGLADRLLSGSSLQIASIIVHQCKNPQLVGVILMVGNWGKYKEINVLT